MDRVEAFGVRNIRSFGEARQLIPIKKINVFVGKNSCGKSTFLRSYPLLRQSVESNTRSAILWYGSYVDFGDINTALHDGSREAFFDFKVSVGIKEELQKPKDKGLVVESFSSELFEYKEDISRELRVSADVALGLTLDNKKSIQTSTEVRVGNTGINIAFGANRLLLITVNRYQGDDCSGEILETTVIDSILVRSKGSVLLTRFYGTRKAPDEKGRELVFAIENYLQDFSNSALVKFLKKYSTSGGRFPTQKVERLSFGTQDSLISQLLTIFKADDKFLDNMSLHGPEIAGVCVQYLVIKNLEVILEACDKAIKQTFTGVRYLGPLRASAERFYRHQDLEIDEVDHKGENLPMVINSLSSEMKKKLSRWISENFGFELELATSGLHYEIKIKEENDSKFHNLSDMGFGYSQILPVIVSIWLETVPRPRSMLGLHMLKDRSRTIVIEQPELHLHPALQHRFGSALAKVIKMAASKNFRFVIETHSSQIIEALGEAIRHDVIADDDVNIVLFEKNENDCTEITLSGFDSEGYLLNWPIGFLSA